MTRFNLQAILLALVVLGSLLVGRPENKQPEESTAQIKIVVTSVGAGQQERQSMRGRGGKKSTVAARSFLVKRLNDSQPLAARRAGQRWPMASFTKLMTAVVALENLPPGQLVTFNDKILATEGSAGAFHQSDSFPVTDLVQALVTVSSNDAAMALASAVGYQSFVDAMQIKAAELGMRQTTFFDPTGLSFLNQSTIEDLEKLVRHTAEHHPEIFTWSRQPTTVIGGGRRLTNINRFAGRPEFLGGKTGYTDDANGNLISLFACPGQRSPLLIIVLGTSDRFGDTEKLWNQYDSASC